ncbi:TetR/AcrR family transcriptional regulator [Cellulomonas carbonis]|uniref:TetR family transcriptional regulator n=1 Tax=Cellulomonas carbonis T26 TaxID=947969 RepID=A0A0A0BLG5_9CELL|nr:TetR/AcrR family transcriptional regulator [Cellulomonas carbonis]KGM08695.1 TetR family transcriptional regulator [Cellulomonas carbonis T26]GGC05568.1 hypothetical protein GCM10010972_18470 [Cellulomonas carbonis]
MPRITAPTVAEHRAQQRAAVLRAAEEIVVEQGRDALTIAAVAARTGLARPSVYAYVRSVDDLLVALVRAGFERWAAALERHTADATDPRALVVAWFEAAAASAAAGDHRLAAALGGVSLPDEVRGELLDGHRRTALPLADAARRLGVGDPEAALGLVLAVVHHTVARVEAGADPDDEARRAAAFVLDGLGGLRGGPDERTGPDEHPERPPAEDLPARP